MTDLSSLFRRGRRVRRVIVAALFVSSFIALFTSSPSPAVAQTQRDAASMARERDAALRALAARLNLPLVDEAVAIFAKQLRRTLPAYFVDGLGENLGLGAQWRPGNPDFDRMLRQVDTALAAEEARGGPLLRLDRGDLLYAVNIPWTLDDIAFVAATLDTDLGHEAERAIDAKAAEQTIATLKRRVALGPDGQGVRAALADLDARAQAQFGDASLMLLAMKGTDPVRTQRLQRLVEAVTIAPSDTIGQRVVERLSQRLLDAAARLLPDILANAGVYRR